MGCRTRAQLRLNLFETTAEVHREIDFKASEDEISPTSLICCVESQFRQFGVRDAIFDKVTALKRGLVAWEGYLLL